MAQYETLLLLKYIENCKSKKITVLYASSPLQHLLEMFFTPINTAGPKKYVSDPRKYIYILIELFMDIFKVKPKCNAWCVV
jgi:hypothetical protein